MITQIEFESESGQLFFLQVSVSCRNPDFSDLDYIIEHICDAELREPVQFQDFSDWDKVRINAAAEHAAEQAAAFAVQEHAEGLAERRAERDDI